MCALKVLLLTPASDVDVQAELNKLHNVLATRLPEIQFIDFYARLPAAATSLVWAKLSSVFVARQFKLEGEPRPALFEITCHSATQLYVRGKIGPDVRSRHLANVVKGRVALEDIRATESGNALSSENSEFVILQVLQDFAAVV